MEEEKSKFDISNILLMVFVIVMFITNIGIAVIQGFVDNWFKMPIITGILMYLQILRNLCYILPAFAIKNKTCRITGIILSSIMVAYLLCSPIMQMWQN